MYLGEAKITLPFRGASRRQCGSACALLAICILALESPPGRAGDPQTTAFGFTLPVDCRLGEECFVQQMPDIDPGEQVLDPMCGKATYQGHDGWDIRVRSLKDIDRRMPVVTVADGTVARTRDGIPDRIYDRAQDKDTLAGKECGNGVVVEHAGGLVSQYCHLKEGSVAVAPGTRVKKGDTIGSIGASGFAEFPHVHLSIRRDGKPIEPLTGRPLGRAPENCGDTTGSLFEPAARAMLSRSASAILQIGLTATPPQSSSLVRSGESPVPEVSEPIIAWVWAINVELGSFFRIRLLDPHNGTVMEIQTGPVDGRKANYVAYAGGKLAKTKGSYRLHIDLLSGGKTVSSMAHSIEIGR